MIAGLKETERGQKFVKISKDNGTMKKEMDDLTQQFKHVKSGNYDCVLVLNIFIVKHFAVGEYSARCSSEELLQEAALG